MSKVTARFSRIALWRGCETLERRVLMAVGDLDPTFSSDGRQLTQFHGYAGALARDVAVQLNGTAIVVGDAGTDLHDEDTNFAIARYLPDGTLDPSFSGGRVVVSPTRLLFGQNARTYREHATSVAVRSDGRIVVGGNVDGANGTFWAVVQLNPDGSVDGSFGLNGATSDSTHVDNLEDLKIDEQGRVVFTGFLGASMMVGRLTPGGLYDQTFNGSGTATIEFPGGPTYAQGTSLELRPDGRIVVGGVAAFSGIAGNGVEFALARLMPNGTIDEGFGSAGRVLTAVGQRLGLSENLDFLESLVIDSGGRIWAAGTINNRDDPTWGVARYQPDGSLDPTFGQRASGCAVAFKSGASYLLGMTLEADGKPILVGSGQFRGSDGALHYQMVVERLLAHDGVVDRTFGGADDYATIEFPGASESGGFAAGVFTDGDILAVGDAGPSGNSAFALARLQGDSPLILFDDIYISGSTWSDGFRDRLATEGKGSALNGYRIDRLKDKFNALPWTDSDEIQFQIQTATADLQSAETLASRVEVAVDGVRQQIVLAAFGPGDDASHQVLRVRFAAPFPSGHLRVRFDGAQDNAGNPLDIAIPNLSGDITLDGVVNAGDLVRVRNRIGRSAANPGAGSDAYVTTVDLNADGVVNAADLVQERNRVGTTLSNNLVVNGGFEQPAFNDAFRLLNPGDTSLPGWTIDGAGIGHIGSYWQASEGNQSVELNLFAAGGISQYVPTQPGKQYRISFDLSGQPNAGPAIKQLQVIWEGLRVDMESFDVTGRTLSDMGWSHREVIVTAKGSSAALRLFGSDPANVDGGPALDNVSVTPVTAAVRAGLMATPFGKVGIKFPPPHRSSIADLLLSPQDGGRQN